MHCWKSINLNKQYGYQKICILSLLTMLLSFVTIYTIISLGFADGKLRDDYTIMFIGGLIILYPIHKLLHLLPLLFAVNKLKMQTGPLKFCPTFSIKVKEPISKRLFLLALLTPIVIGSSFLLFCALLYPSYAHYFTILLSLHIGICVSDIISLKNVMNSPQKCFVEENEDGFEILISK